MKIIPSTKRCQKPQRVLVFEENGSGKHKIAGIGKYGGNRFRIEMNTIDTALPPIVDDASDYLPLDFQADLVLDFLRHPDLTHDLARRCIAKNIPMISSGKKMNIKGIITPPT